ncbi:MAG: hypothetical protein ACLFMO_08145 [Eubacteriales bacterium]
MKKGVYFNIDEQLHRQLKAYAVVHNTTMSKVIEQLIQENCTFGRKELANEKYEELPYEEDEE